MTRIEGNGTTAELAALWYEAVLMEVKVGSDYIEVPVKIMDTRRAWNRIDAQVTPEYGLGTTWVCVDRLRRRPV